MTHRRSTSPATAQRQQRGVALFVALIVMVALSLAGVALIRSVDTSTSVVGNIAFRQSSLLAANWAIEKAAQSIYQNELSTGTVAIADPTADVAAQNYYASIQDYAATPAYESTKTTNPNLPPGVPAILQKKASFPFTPKIDGGKNEIRYVVERMCRLAGAAVADRCDMMPPKQGLGTTVGDEAPPDLGTAPIYRVTVRVDGPQNTGTSFVQAWLH